MKAAEKFALEQGAGSLSLSTAVSNKAGQSLYESEGYLRDDEYLTYYLDLDKKRLELQTSTAPLLQTRLRTLS